MDAHTISLTIAAEDWALLVKWATALGVSPERVAHLVFDEGAWIINQEGLWPLEKALGLDIARHRASHAAPP